MRVSEIIKKLKKYNQDADFEVILNSYSKDFEIVFSGAEGATKDSCDSVCLNIKSYNDEEKLTK